jgi:hypothetical protein
LNPAEKACILLIMKKRIAILLFAPIIGAALGYFLVYALSNGWFKSRWQKIETPPGDGLHLVALSLDSLWVQSDSGAIYYNENASACQSGCWVEVPEIPDLPALGPNETAVTSGACAPSLPLSRVVERLSECRSTMWVDYDVTFALREDGSIYLWQAELFKEWTFVLLVVGVCGGAMLLFLPALAVVLVLAIRDRRLRRSS